MLVTAFGGTDVGCQRTGNEDSILVDEKVSLFIVADGMGGHKGGKTASELAVRVVHRELEKRHAHIVAGLETGSVQARNSARAEVAKAIAEASKEVFDRARADDSLQGMGTTLALMLVVDNEAIVAHVGDSRVYQLRDGVCNQLTEDHSMLQEQLRLGIITPQEAKAASFGNVITRAVGTQETVRADTLTVELMSGDEFVICSDGLHGYLADGELQTLATGCDARTIVARLIELARERGGRDNISVIDVRMVEGNPAEASHTPSDKLKALHNIPLFRFLDYKELVAIVNIISLRAYQAGQDVVVDGEAGEELFVILAGAVEVKKNGKVLATLRPMKHFGEMALMDREPRSATVTAIEPTKVMVIQHSDFLALVRREPSVGVKLLWSFVQVLCQRLRETMASRAG